MESKKRKIGDTVELVDSRPDRSLPVENVTPLGSPTPISQSKDQDKGRLQMLLKRALVERTNQAIDIEDPKDRRYKHLLEEMKLVERSFTHSLKEIDMQDKRIVRLEDELVKSEEQKKLLKCQLDGLQGSSLDTPHPGRSITGQT